MCNPFYNRAYTGCVWNKKFVDIILTPHGATLKKLFFKTFKIYFGVCELGKLSVRSNHLIENWTLQNKQGMTDWLCSDWKMASYRKFKLRSCNRPWHVDTGFGLDLVYCEIFGYCESLLNKNWPSSNQKLWIGSEVASQSNFGLSFWKRPWDVYRGLLFKKFNYQRRVAKD